MSSKDFCPPSEFWLLLWSPASDDTPPLPVPSSKSKNGLENLPKSLAEIVIYENAETCIKSIEAIETAFNEAIENAVNERLRGGKPQRGGQKNIVDYSKMSDAEYYAATYKNKK